MSQSPANHAMPNPVSNKPKAVLRLFAGVTPAITELSNDPCALMPIPQRIIPSSAIQDFPRKTSGAKKEERKSFFATKFVHYLKGAGIVHRAIDSDHENSTLKRFHPEVDFINLDNRREIDRVFTAAEMCDLLLIDCRAASTDLFIDFFDEIRKLDRTVLVQS